MLENKIDILAISETWLRDGETAAVAELKPPGYQFHHMTRDDLQNEDRRGGGVGFLVRAEIDHQVVETKTKYDSFEMIEMMVHMKKRSIRLINVYRPQRLSNNEPSWEAFKTDFSGFLSTLTSSSGKLIIVGDMNVAVNKIDDPHVLAYNRLLNENDLVQHIDLPTHINNNTLDHVCTRAEVTTPLAIRIIEPPGTISDHAMLIFDVKEMRTEDQKRKTISYRRWGSLDKEVFAERVSRELEALDRNNSSDQILMGWTETYKTILDDMIPIKTKQVSSKTAPSWYSNEIQQAKAKRRKLERTWRRRELREDWDRFRTQTAVVKNLLYETKKSFYQDQIQSNAGNQKELYKIINSLLDRTKERILPKSNTNHELAEKFLDYFTSKIEKIRDGIQSSVDSEVGLDPHQDAIPCQLTFESFTPVTDDNMELIIRKLKLKQCSLDIMPTWMLKEHAAITAPVLTSIINASTRSGEVPEALKEAVVTPILKKPSANPEDLANYRPVSNINVIGKILEQVVANQLRMHLQDNALLEPLQSAYRPQHSTETALAKVYNDLTAALDEKKMAILLLLDLSAAFDTIDHGILLKRCEKVFGITGVALTWIKSYMEDRTQRVQIGNSSSTPRRLTCGVPQGSVLGPLLFIMYTTPLGDLLRKENIAFHMYADDTQVYAVSTLDNVEAMKAHVEGAVEKIRCWMAANLLKLNPSKTEFIVIRNKNQINDVITELDVGGITVEPSDHARNIGVVFDSTLSMAPHISTMTRTLNMHLRNIARIRKFLSSEATETLMHALITSRLDYGNALLAMQPACRLRSLQLAQNTAARIVCQLNRMDHITPALINLHWLPVAQRVKFKLCVLTYKAVHQLAPPYMNAMIQSYAPSRHLRSETSSLLVVPRTRSMYGERSFSVAGPREWNALPTDIRECAEMNDFKAKLKTYLFLQAFDA